MTSLKSWKRTSQHRTQSFINQLSVLFWQQVTMHFPKSAFYHLILGQKTRNSYWDQILWIISSNFRQFCSKPLISCLFFVFSLQLFHPSSSSAPPFKTFQLEKMGSLKTLEFECFVSITIIITREFERNVKVQKSLSKPWSKLVPSSLYVPSCQISF